MLTYGSPGEVPTRLEEEEPSNSSAPFVRRTAACSVSQHHLAVPHQGWRGWRGNCLRWKYQPPIIQAVTFLCGSSSEEQREGEASQRSWKTLAFLQTPQNAEETGRFLTKDAKKKVDLLLPANFLPTSCVSSVREGLSPSGGL